MHLVKKSAHLQTDIYSNVSRWQLKEGVRGPVRGRVGPSVAQHIPNIHNPAIYRSSAAIANLQALFPAFSPLESAWKP